MWWEVSTIKLCLLGICLTDLYFDTATVQCEPHSTSMTCVSELSRLPSYLWVNCSLCHWMHNGRQLEAHFYPSVLKLWTDQSDQYKGLFRLHPQKKSRPLSLLSSINRGQNILASCYMEVTEHTEYHTHTHTHIHQCLCHDSDTMHLPLGSGQATVQGSCPKFLNRGNTIIHTRVHSEFQRKVKAAFRESTAPRASASDWEGWKQSKQTHIFFCYYICVVCLCCQRGSRSSTHLHFLPLSSNWAKTSQI